MTIRGARRAIPGSAVTATCSVCRSQQKVRAMDGKIGSHGKSAANPRGCPGTGQAPYRPPKQGGPSGGAIVVGFRQPPPQLRIVSKLPPPPEAC